MPTTRPNRVEMIPISRITVLNPRARNKRQHREIVNNIEAVGLKRPITVSRQDGPGGPRYDLVCGEVGRETLQNCEAETFRVPSAKVSVPAVTVTHIGQPATKQVISTIGGPYI